MERKLVIIVIVAFLLLIYTSTRSLKVETKIALTNATVLEKKIGKDISRTIASIKVPAVDAQGNGVVTTLKVEAIPGNGKILVNINNLLFWVDTQYSIRVAQEVAKKIIGEELSDVDLIYTIETEASLIEGQSAGAAIAIATVAALQNKSINQSVMITGTINQDGTIGPVGAIIPKAKAAKDVGAKLFLVPKGQGVQVIYKPVRHCEKIGPVTFCTTEYKQEEINVIEEAGIEVREVANLDEALKYFLIQ